MSIDEYVYWGGLLQGEGLREYIDNFRRRMFDSASAIFWMYNDCWPCTRSWTTVDFFLNRTPSFHPVRRAFELLRTIVVENETTVDIYGVNDTLEEARGEIRYGLFTVEGKYLIDKSSPAVLVPNARTLLASFEKSNWKDPATEVAFAELSFESRLISRNRLLLPLLKDMRWPAPSIQIRVEDGHAIFTSNTFVAGVCLDLDGIEISDNFFDLFPSTEHRIPWNSPTAPKVLYTANLLGNRGLNS
jgi:beta-mannosidase